MPKLKTKKLVAKRFIITKNKKVLKASGGQDHFNARETGKVSRNKKRDQNLSAVFNRTVRALAGGK
ncbi:MAG: 50S ribosomal protein L35 [bacterium]|nr:50S ribosomal protein L35 [bacterium]